MTQQMDNATEHQYSCSEEAGLWLDSRGATSEATNQAVPNYSHEFPGI